MKKRLLSIVLTVVMVLSIMPIIANARLTENILKTISESAEQVNEKNDFGSAGEKMTEESPYLFNTSENIQVAAGYKYSVVLKEDGTVWTWGNNTYGQLGDGTTISKSIPAKIAGLTDVKKIAVGFSYVLVLKKDGAIWAWGSNSYGQLGDGTTEDRNTPTKISGLTDVKDIAAGDAHALVLKEDGTIWAWGSNSYGQLGDGTTENRSTPVKIDKLTGIKAVALGSSYTMALKEDGTVYTWGNNSHGQLGYGPDTVYNTPYKISQLTDVKAIAAGGSHAVALKKDGTIYTWGNNSNGQLGRITDPSKEGSPYPLSGLTDVNDIAAGGSHTMALKEDGTVYTWGNNSYGQLGDGTTADHTTPTQVDGLTDVINIAAGYSHTLVGKENVTVYAWGDNSYGQLGDEMPMHCSVPTPIDNLTEIKNVIAGNQYIAALKKDGSVYTWGRNNNGQLGDGTTASHVMPTKITELADVKEVAAEFSHTAALKEDGTVYTWGSNGDGELGDGTITSRTSPAKVSGVADVKAIAVGNSHTVALKKDGTVYTWGSNSSGQLGDGTTKFRSTTPVQVSGLTDVKAITAGYEHTLALKEDGTVYAWGDNYCGVLGDGTFTSRNIPVQVSGLTGVKAIETGYMHTIALKEDGTVYVWGNNARYQLGDGISTNKFQTTPFKIESLIDVQAVALGKYHTIVLKENGTVYAWGDNSKYQLGEETMECHPAPAIINGLYDIKAIAGGDDYTAALKADGTIYTWGDNIHGQLGYGHMPYSTVPYEVKGIRPNKNITKIDTKQIKANQGLVLGVGEKIHAIGGVPTMVNVPQTVTAYFDDGTSGELFVKWDDTTYKPYQTGKQTITGTVETANTGIDNPSELSAELEIVVIPTQYEVFSISPENISATVLGGTPIEQIYKKLSPKTIDIEAINTETGEMVYIYSDYTLDSTYSENANYNPNQLGTQFLIGRFHSCIIDTFMLPYVEIEINVIESEISNIPSVEMDAYQSMEFADNTNMPQQVTVETVSGVSMQVDVKWNSSNYQKNLAGDQIITGKLVNLPSSMWQTDPEKIATLIVHVHPVNYKITSVVSDILDFEMDAGYTLEKVQNQLPIHTVKVQLESTNLDSTIVAEYDIPFILESERNPDYMPDVAGLYILAATFDLPGNIENPEQYVYEIFLVTNPVGIQLIEPVYVTAEMGTGFADIEKTTQVCVILENGNQEWIDVDWGTGEGYVSDSDELTEDNPIQSTVKGTLCNRPEYINYAGEQADLIITVILPRVYYINSITPERIPANGEVKVELGSSLEEIYNALETHAVTVELRNLKNVVFTQEITFTLRTEDNPDYDPMSESVFELTAYLNLPEGIENPDDKQLTISMIPTKYIIKSAVVVRIGGVIVGTPFEEIGLPENTPVTYTDNNTGELPVSWSDATYSLTKIGAQAIKGSFNTPLPIYIENPNNRQPAAALTVVNPSVRILSAVPVENARMFDLDNKTNYEQLSGLKMRDYRVELLHKDGSIITEIISVFEEVNEN